MTLTEKVLYLYDHGFDSLKPLSKISEVSVQTVRRILITNGRWVSEVSAEIGRLHSDGLSASEIADELGLSYSTVVSYLPYPKGPRAEWPDTINAQRIRKTREKKKHQDES